MPSCMGACMGKHTHLPLFSIQYYRAFLHWHLVVHVHEEWQKIVMDCKFPIFRFHWREEEEGCETCDEGRGELYAYFPEDDLNGRRLGIGRWHFVHGAWQKITQRIYLGTAGLADGAVEVIIIIIITTTTTTTTTTIIIYCIYSATSIQ